MVKTVQLQAAMTVTVALLAAVVGGFHAALSAMLGGLACLVPSGLFALRLALETRRSGGATVHGFFVGEFVKLAVTVLMLFAIANFYRDLNWLALIVGFIAALKSYLLIFLFGIRRV